MRPIQLLIAAMILINTLQAQNSFLKAIRDSLYGTAYGRVAYIGQDSAYIHMVYNTGFSRGGICSGNNGTIFYAKLNKATGQVLQTSAMNGGLNITRAITCYLHNGFLYIGGEQLIFQGPSIAFIMKFNTQTNDIVWHKHFRMGHISNTGPCFITDLRLDNSNKIVFYGTGFFSQTGWPNIQPLTGSFKGGIDTAGANITFMSTGYNPAADEYKTNPKFYLSPSNKYYAIACDETSQKVIIVRDQSLQYPLYSSSTGYEPGLQSTGHYFVNRAGHKMLYVIDKPGGTTCLLTDTLNNMLLAKDLNGLHARSLSVHNNNFYISLVNDLGGNQSNALINIKTDSLLNTSAEKKLMLAPFNTDQFGCSSTADNNYVYQIFNTRNDSSRYVHAYKQSFSLPPGCNEQVFIPAFTTFPVSSVPASIITMGGGTVQPLSMQTMVAPVIDSLYCTVTPPVSNFMAPSTLCTNTTYTLTDSSTNGAVLWQWQAGGTQLGNPALQNQVVTFTASGVFNVTLTVSNYGGSSSIVKTLTVNATPQPGITTSRHLICEGESAMLTATGATTFLWNNYSGGPQFLAQPMATADYTLVASNGSCSTQVVYTQYVSACTGINQLEVNDGIDIYPNPNNGRFKITLAENADILIVNILGEVVYNASYPSGTNDFDLQQRANGIYFVKVLSKSGSSAFKVIKQ